MTNTLKSLFVKCSKKFVSKTLVTQQCFQANVLICINLKKKTKEFLAKAENQQLLNVCFFQLQNLHLLLIASFQLLHSKKQLEFLQKKKEQKKTIKNPAVSVAALIVCVILMTCIFSTLDHAVTLRAVRRGYG